MSHLEETSRPLLGDSELPINPFEDEPPAFVPDIAASSGSVVTPPASGGPLFTVCPYILANEFCERLAYYGLATNLVSYFTDVMNFEKDTALSSQQAWSGTCYLTAIIGAVVADSSLGRRVAALDRKASCDPCLRCAVLAELWLSCTSVAQVPHDSHLHGGLRCRPAATHL
jgi:hypothetical protein